MDGKFGKYRGLVVDNVDPLDLGRIQVMVPNFPGFTPNWAMPCVPYAGPQVGFFFIPPIGASVWVEFEGGEVNKPIWVGCFWQEGQMPARPGPPLQKVLRTKFVTMIMDDTPEAGGFTLNVLPPALEPEATMSFTSEGMVFNTGEGTLNITPESIMADLGPSTLAMTDAGINLGVGDVIFNMSEAEASIAVPPTTVSVTEEAVNINAEDSNVTISPESIEAISGPTTVTISPAALEATSAEASQTLSAEGIILEIGASNIIMEPVGTVLSDGAVEII